MNEKEILEGLKPICQCQGIKKRRFLEHIASGVTTVADLKAATGAGEGSCRGKRCTPRIAELLNSAHPQMANLPDIGVARKI